MTITYRLSKQIYVPSNRLSTSLSGFLLESKARRYLANGGLLQAVNKDIVARIAGLRTGWQPASWSIKSGDAWIMRRSLDKGGAIGPEVL
eukprot:scaffold6271_cov18-Prasinocladus_malaysianus.AAC.2